MLVGEIREEKTSNLPVDMFGNILQSCTTPKMC